MPRLTIKSLLASVFVLGFAALAFVSAAPARAAITINVTDTSDVVSKTDGKCTLREAIIAANTDSQPTGSVSGECPAGSGTDFIELQNGGIYTLTKTGSGEDNAATGDLDLNASVNIYVSGAGTATIQADSSFDDRILHITGSFTVKLTGVILRGGKAGDNGGGILNNGGALTLTDSTVDSNTSTSAGGGIFNQVGTLTLDQTTVSNNTASAQGGGIYVFGGTLNLTNSTLSGNQSDSDGGGLYVLSGTANLKNATITDNTSNNDAVGVGNGGGVFRVSGTVNVHNTILAGNHDQSPTKDPDCAGTLTSQGHNLVGNNSGCSGFTNGTNGDQVGTNASPLDPKLSALGNHGGNTRTHALLAGSPAIDAGDDANCLGHDQRSVPRPLDGDNDAIKHCDIGAYELASKLSVNQTFDAVDAYPGDGVCETAAGNNQCTLRAAIMEGNVVAGTIALPAGTYNLSIPGSNDDAAATGDLDIRNDLTIQGVGASSTVIQWDPAIASTNRDRILHVLPGAALNLSGVTITGGNAGNRPGGGILNQGTLQLTRSAVTGNSTTLDGGGIFNNGDSLIINASTISNNTARSGGGIYNDSVTTLTNSTISGNHANGGGGGLASSTPIARPSSFTSSFNLNNVTITNNTADETGTSASGGGGIFNPNIVSLKNTLVAGNHDNASSNQKPDCIGTLTSQGHNLLGNNQGCSGLTNGSNGDQVGTAASPLNPKLGNLANNGGPTLTHSLLFNSPALDAGEAACTDINSNPVTTDQRGGVRPVNSNSNPATACDIGAFEYAGLKPAAPKLVAPGNNTVQPAQVTFKWKRARDTLKYKLFVNGTRLKTTSGNQFTANLPNPGTYTWFVKACNSFGCAKSATRSFTR